MKKRSKLYIVLLSTVALFERKEKSIVTVQGRKHLENNLVFVVVYG